MIRVEFNKTTRCIWNEPKVEKVVKFIAKKTKKDKRCNRNRNSWRVKN